MIKILIGGSPCTHWSIAQKNNRETTAEGIGWELFKNYLIAKEKFQPDFFLYENNKSAAQAIRNQISIELGVPLQYINSALVSAQNRQRFYVHNIPNVPQPEDRGILLKDILESGNVWTEKSYALTTRCLGAIPEDTIKKHRHTMVAQPITVLNINPSGKGMNGSVSQINGKSRCLTTNKGEGQKIIEPVRIGTIENDAKNQKYDSKQYRVYSPDGKATTICGQGGGLGAKTGLYAVPFEVNEATKKGYTAILSGDCVDMTQLNSKTRRGRNMKDKCNCLNTSNEYYQYCGTIDQPIYEVKDGLITIKGKQYPIKLVDGYYIIRKLTVTECCRLQTLPDNYCRAVSNSQAYKGLGNGWTAEVIIHNLKHMNIPLDEEIVVLSMYDGIGTGRYCFDKLGYKNIKYYAYEIDKYAMQVAMSNYTDII
jgi:DNA (cytosine-5)-methyltransferase 3A